MTITWFKKKKTTVDTTGVGLKAYLCVRLVLELLGLLDVVFHWIKPRVRHRDISHAI